jgi:protease-4
VRRRLRGSALGTGPGHWLHLRIDGDPPEIATLGFRGRGEHPGLLDWLRCLDAAAQDPRVGGVLFELRGDASSPTAGAALRRCIETLRAASKRTVAWVDAPGLMQYAIAASCHEVFAPESAQLQLTGLRIEQFYFKDLLDRLDVRADVVHVGRYKSAAEPATRSSMSDPQREQLEAWQQTHFEQLIAAIGRGRSLARDAVETLVDRALHPARTAAEAGLIDGCCYLDELIERIEQTGGGEDAPGRATIRAARIQDAASYLHRDVLAWDGAPGVLGPSVAVAYVVGAGSIGRGERAAISQDAFSSQLESFRTDAEVRAVVLRLDCPGGDALVSDLLHHEILKLRSEKPVVASFGDVAASGGYYLATAADRVFAEPESLTGSIGVVGGKVDLSRLYERLGVTKESVGKGARSGLFSEASGFSSPDRRALGRELEEIYDIFLRRVSEGRGLDPAEVARIAEGRVWSGVDAERLGLVDELGGPLEALARARRLAGIAPEETPRVVAWPIRTPWSDPLAWIRAR